MPCAVCVLLGTLRCAKDGAINGYQTLMVSGWSRTRTLRSCLHLCSFKSVKSLIAPVQSVCLGGSYLPPSVPPPPPTSHPPPPPTSHNPPPHHHHPTTTLNVRILMPIALLSQVMIPELKLGVYFAMTTGGPNTPSFYDGAVLATAFNAVPALLSMLEANPNASAPPPLPPHVDDYLGTYAFMGQNITMTLVCITVLCP